MRDFSPPVLASDNRSGEPRIEEEKPMSIVLGPEEQVFFPQPYVPGEPANIIITNKRLVRITDMGMAEFPVRDIDYVGRTSHRPFKVLGVVLILGALVMLVSGVYAAVTNTGPINRLFEKKQEKIDTLPTLPALPTPGGAAPAPSAEEAPAEEEAPPKDDEEAAPEDTEAKPSKPGKAILGQVGGLIMAGGSLVVLLVGVVLVRRQRHEVTCRVGGRMTTLEVADQREQTVILSTLGSAVSTSKMIAAQAPAPSAPAAAPMPPPAAAPSPAEVAAVDDGGDPVKALQELKAQKDAGKVDAATFERKRAALLARLSQR
jgi:hypothetical protein